MSHSKFVCEDIAYKLAYLNTTAVWVDNSVYHPLKESFQEKV